MINIFFFTKEKNKHVIYLLLKSDYFIDNFSIFLFHKKLLLLLLSQWVSVYIKSNWWFKQEIKWQYLHSIFLRSSLYVIYFRLCRHLDNLDSPPPNTQLLILFPRQFETVPSYLTINGKIVMYHIIIEAVLRIRKKTEERGLGKFNSQRTCPR